MTPEEAALLQRIGTVLLLDLATVTTVSLFYGMLILLFSTAISTMTRRGLKSRATLAMFSVTLVSFLLGTLYWISSVAVFVIQIREPLVHILDAPLDRARLTAINKMIFPYARLASWTNQLLPIVSDAVVIWRAWVLFAEQRWVMIGPLTLLLATTGATLAYLGLTSSFAVSVTDNKGGISVTANLVTASIALSLVTNAVSTLLILYKLWTHRAFIKNLGQEKIGRNSRVQNVMLLLIESGAMYCIIQLLSLILESRPIAKKSVLSVHYAGSIIIVGYALLSAMYPAVVVVLVDRQRSFVETFGFSTAMRSNGAYTRDPGQRPATVGHLSFAPPPTLGTSAEKSSPGHLSSLSSSVEVDQEVGTPETAAIMETKNKNVDDQQVRTAPF
ncbi:hypothetical protein D9615_004307 [Tricholomella constricta]|uniref:Uncharacterized protein n=1 Tax=Tricholomella constricta TaxID=117010 RepID=A0A8H5M660_9AGAR|nr:hypothetical protein D9615_004307 [Tricholomella constricta]